MIHIGALEQVANQLDMDLLAVAAEPFAVARSVIGDADDSTMSAILMDVGGGTTDIAVLNEGGVQGTQMFGIGGRAFTRSIARELEVGFVEAEKLKLGLGDGTAPTQLSEKLEKAVDKTVRVWRSGIELALNEYDSLEHLPHHILLCGGGASLETLTKELESADWYRKLPFARKPSIHFIQPEAVFGIEDTTGTLDDHTFVTAMGLLRVGLDTISQSEEVSDEATINSRINRLLRI
jgi:cell division protein FtsA